MTFETKTLGEVSSFSNNLRKPVTRSQRLGGQYPYYGAASIQDFVSEFLFDGRYILVGEDGTVVTEKNRPVVQIADGKFWVNNHAHVIQPIDMDDFEYLYYSLVNSNISELVTGAVQPKLSMTNLKSLNLEWAVMSSVRQSIGNVLGLLDAKISINRKISETLDQIAQTIFKSWFIDFDPVKAKMAGEMPVGMDDATAALFPNSIEDSELGPIPKGWTWGSVGDIALVIDCLHSKKPELLPEGRPYLQLDTIHDDGVLRFEKAVQISDVDYQKWTSRIEVCDGDCVITNVGRVGAVSQVPSHFKGAIGRNITALRPTDETLYKTFLAIVLTSSFMKKEIRTNTDSGTILEALNVRSIPKLRLPIVGAPLFEAFERLCGPMQTQRQNLHRENVKLAETRDSLLPRLISGELQIPAEMLVA